MQSFLALWTLIISVSSAVRADVTDDEAIRRVDAFREVALKGTADKICLPMHNEVKPWIEKAERPGNVRVHFGSCYADVSRKDGTILTFRYTYGSSEDAAANEEAYDPSQQIGRSTLDELLSRYAKAAGFSMDVEAMTVGTQTLGTRSNTPVLSVLAEPVAEGTHCLLWVSFDVHYRTGELLGMNLVSQPPALPASLTPSVTKWQAQASALGAIVARSATNVLWSPAGSPDLKFWRPARAETPNVAFFLADRDVALGQANGSLLVWRDVYRDLSDASRSDRFQAVYEVLIDAQDGRVLMVQRWTGSSQVGGTVPRGVKVTPATWKGLGQATAVIVHGKGVPVSPSSLTAVTELAPRRAGIAVVVVFGKKAVKGRYLAAEGLLVASIGGKELVGKPSGALARALRLAGG